MLSRFLAFRCARNASCATTFLVLAVALLIKPSLAQTQVAQIAPGSSATVYDNGINSGDAPNTWTITGAGVSVSNSSPGSWVVPKFQSTNGSFHVGVPASAPLESYSYTYTNSSKINDPGGGGYTYSGGTGTFKVVSAIPAPAPGPAYPWQASVGGVNTANGNKMTVIPITGFATPGGMSISLALTHNSQTTYSNFNGQKWTFSYLDFITTSGNTATVYWGDGRVYSFTLINGKYLPPTGIYDTLTYSGGDYTLVTQNQVMYHFNQAVTINSTPYNFLSSMVDQNDNIITVSYPNSGSYAVQSVSDSTGRALNFTYASGLMTKVTDPLGRAWTFGYTGSDLTTVNVPPLADGVAHAYVIGYDPNGHHDITSFKDLNGNTAQIGYYYSTQNTVTDTAASLQDPKGNTLSFGYTGTSTGLTTTTTDLNGNATKYFYAIQLRSVTDAAGKTASFDYDTYNTLTSQTDMRGYATNYGTAYNTSVTPVQVTGVTTTDPVGNVTTTAYTRTNKIASVIKPSPNTSGATVTASDTYSTDGRDNLTTATSPTPDQVGTANATTVNSTISYAYFTGKNSQTNTNVQWWLPSETKDQTGVATQFGYDTNGYLNSVTDGSGDLFTSGYNSIGWLAGVSTHPSTTETDTTGYTYDAWGRVTSVIAPDLTKTSMTYDLNGNVLRVEDANANDGTLNGGVAWTAGYFGDALQFDGSTGWVDLGNKPDLNFTGPITISALIKPSNVFASGYQDIVAHGYQTGSPQGEVALRINNGYYEIESTGAAGGEGAKWPVPSGDQGQWVNLIGTFDGTTWHLYHNGTQVATGPGTQGAVPVSVDWALGAAYSGPGLTSRYFSGTIDDVRIFDRAVTASEVAALNVPTSVSTVGDGLLGYWRLDDGAGATTVDWCHSVTNAYDADNRLAWTFNGHLDFVQYFYDADSGKSTQPHNPYQAKQYGLLSYKTDGNGHTTYYVYDVDNRPVETIRPDGTTTTVAYDEDGNVHTRLDGNGLLTTYTYDGDDRLTNAVHTINSNGKPYYDRFGNSDDVILAYNPASLISSMTDYTEVTSWNYDNAGNALSIGGSRGTVSYTYYNNNLRKTMSELSPAEPSPVTWQYAYDDANRPESLVDPFNGTILFGFDMAGRLTTKTFPNGVKTTTGYDTCSEVKAVTTINSAGNVTLTSSTYYYDYAGNLTQRTDGDGTAASFFYNGADQLTFENYAQSGNNSYIAYAYDHNGNRTSQSNSGIVTNYTYDAGDKLTSDSNGGTYTYDYNGNWTSLAGSASTYTFTYDSENRLDYYTAPGMSSAYSYNGMGLRVAENDSSTGERDLINDGVSPGSSLLVDHNIAAKTVAHVYTPGLEQRDGLSNSIVHLMGVDALGSVRGFINDDLANSNDQSVTDTQSYDGYGITRSRTGNDWMAFGFAGADGYQTDPNELMLLGNREYHPFTGRFLTRDPAGAGDNDYEYADDNPLRYTDPKGLYPQGVVDHPGGGDSGGSSWFSGDDFDGTYGATAGSGTIAVPVYYAIFTADKKTGDIEGYEIKGLAGYELISLYGPVNPYISLLKELDKLNYKTLQKIIPYSNGQGQEWRFFVGMGKNGLQVEGMTQTQDFDGGNLTLPPGALSWAHTHPNNLNGVPVTDIDAIENFSTPDNDTTRSFGVPGYLGCGDGFSNTYTVKRYMPGGPGVVINP